MKPLVTWLSFPTICACLGGAEYAKIGVRYVKVKLPGRPDEVRLLKSRLPNVESYTAFNLAEAASKVA